MNRTPTFMVLVGLVVAGSIAGCSSKESDSAAPAAKFPLNEEAAKAARAGNFYSDPALGLTVTEFPWVFTPMTGGATASSKKRSLTGLVTIAGKGAHRVKVTEAQEYLDTGEVGTISVDIVDLDANNGRTYVVSQSGLSIEVFDLQAYGDGLGYFFNPDDHTFTVYSTSGVVDVDSAKDAVQAGMTDERFSGASPWGFAMAYAMGQYVGSQLCADPANCPFPEPTCTHLPNLCECAICTKLELSTCGACP